MPSTSVDEPISSPLTERLLQSDDGSVSSDSHHESPQDTDVTNAAALIIEEKEEKGEEGENINEEISVNSGSVEDWDLVSPLLLSSATSRVLRSRLRYNDSIDDDGETEEVSSQFRDGILPGFVSPLEAFLTVTAGFMALSFACLVVGSFYFSWSDTTLRVHIDTFLASNDSNKGSPIQFDVPLYKNATFQTTLSIFRSSHSYMIVHLVIVSALIIPSIWMMVYPNLVVGMHKLSKSKYQATSSIHHDTRGSGCSLSILSRWWFGTLWTHERIGQLLTVAEIFMKFSLTIIYVQSILLVCTSGIDFTLGSSMASMSDYIDKERQTVEGDDKYDIFARVVSNTRGGSISYLIGISFGVTTAALVRLHWRRQDNFLRHGCSEKSEIVEHDLSLEVQCVEAPPVRLQDRSNSLLSPPTSAFRLLNEVVSENNDEGQNNGGVEFDNVNSQGVDEKMIPLIGSTEIDQAEENVTQKLRICKCPLFATIILIESGILSIIMLYPMLTLPLIRLDYTGMTVPLITKTKHFLTLGDIIRSVSSNSGDGFLPFIAKFMFWMNIVIAPLMSLITCLSIWFVEHWKARKPLKIYDSLQFVHPSANSTPFAISMLITVASLNLVSDYLFNKYHICEILADALRLDNDEEKCLVINGALLPGFWFLLLQGLCLDVFVRATLAAR